MWRGRAGGLRAWPAGALTAAWLLSGAPAVLGGNPPVIINQPADLTIFYGEPATFSEGVAGTAPFAYQWFRDGAPIGSATGSAYTLALTSSNDQGAGFSVTVTNSWGAATSDVAVLTVDLGSTGSLQTNHLLSFTDTWKYNQTATNLDAVWMLPGYNDTVAGWSNGPGVFDAKYSGTNPAPRTTIGGQPVGTQLALKQSDTNRVTYYFRKHFTFHPWQTSQVVSGRLQATSLLDDGAVFYLNGQEGYRVGVTNTAYNGWASRIVADAAPEYFTLPITNLVEGDNLIAVAVHQCNSGSSDITFGLDLGTAVYPRLRDTNAPTVTEVFPAPGTTLPALAEIEVHFSEGVKGVQAGDLLINNVPATNFTAFASDVYVFDFPPPPTGVVQVAWSPGQAITDLSANSNRFAGGSFTYVLDPAAVSSSVMISEFMAGNTHTIRDEDGHYSDWIEIYNASQDPVNLSHWYLTDNAAKLTKWQFPAGVSLMARSYLLVWASGNNRTNPATPLHTNFKLDKAAGNFLGLVYSDGITVVSAFSPYPQQYDDVSYGRDRYDPSLVGCFTNATPGAPNATLGPGFGPEVQFSVASGTFRQPVTVALSTTDSNSVIRYFLVTNGATAAMTGVPNGSSPIYTNPLTFIYSVQVRARAFPTQPNLFPGPPHSETYIQVASDSVNVTSDLPIVVFHNMGGGAVPNTVEQFMTMQVFDTRNGRSALTNPPDLAVQGVFHRRGQATLNYPKASLRVETRDDYGDNRDVELLGMPADNDWIFYGIDQYDKVLMHNPLTHDLYRELGRYTSRTRFVEVYLKDDIGTPGPINGIDYNGLYVLEEKIKIAKNRVDIDKLQPENTNAPSVTGGYLLSIDKWKTGDPPEFSAAAATMFYLDPDYYDITNRPAQMQYIPNYLNTFYSALTGPNWTNPATGYPAYLDVDSWIDYHLHQTLVFNVDALRISAYFYKPRDGKLVQGPLWDFDRAFGTRTADDGRGFNPRLWRSLSMDGGTDMFNPGNTFNNPWYSVLFKDPDFWQRWIDRYQELRKTTYHLTNLMARIDYYGNQVREATTREYARWRGSGASDTTPRSGPFTADGMAYVFPTPGTWQGEIDFTKYWFSNRVDFMDTNFLNPPVFSSNGGAITSGFTLTITAPTLEPNSTIYYTLDGTDPRLPGGAASPKASSSLNAAAITLTNNARVFARDWNPAHSNLTGTSNNPPISSPWSGPTVGTFIVATPPLAITEIMYHPAAPASGTNDNDDFEFIELKNVGARSLNLLGVRFTNGLDFTFTATNAITNLGPGQYLVLARNTAAFLSRYPGVTNLAGQYSGSLDNGGERLYLEGALKEPILDFKYSDAWYPATDGNGFSLVIRNENAPFYSWTNPASWRASAALGGSPGRADPTPPDIPPVVINEALTHTDLPQVDSIELFNPTANAAPIGGWFLTDDHDQPLKYCIPTNTVIPAGGFVVVTENEFNTGASNSFALGSLGDEVYLFSGDGTNITGYRHGFTFGAQVNGATFGRYVTSDGLEHFVTQEHGTLGSPNAGPKVGPIVINEIMYAPPPFGLDADKVDEYIELRNVTPWPVPLFDTLHPTNAWKLDGGIQYTFPLGITMAPLSYLLVVPFDPVHDPAALSWFQARYSLDTNTPLFGPFQGSLANEGERVGLYLPDKPEQPPSPVAGFVPYVLVEEVNYSDLPPWPGGADGTGNSLQRIASLAFGDDPANWQAAAPTPGRMNQGAMAADTDHDGLPDEWELAHGLDPKDPTGLNGPLGDPDMDSLNNLQEFIAGTDPLNSQDYLRFDAVTITNSLCVLSFTAHPGRLYTVEILDTLDPANTWTTLVNTTGDGPVTVADSLTPTARFYRLKVRLNP